MQVHAYKIGVNSTSYASSHQVLPSHQLNKNIITLGIPYLQPRCNEVDCV